ncbi:hypothetical protein ACIFOE_25810 [Paenibacillus sp. NRS-1783]|uniref:hypothetical protein n=1 Tax=Paenibacillus sp. NRS-1783 TaxID=3233907 RepID=UPI003D2C4BE3
MITFFVLGMLDALAELSLILKLYRLPMRQHWFKILLFVIGVSLFSLCMRVYFNLPLLDLPMQYLIFILFLRLGMKIKLHLSAFIAGAGIVDYILLQLGIYSLSGMVIDVGPGMLMENSGTFVHFTQVSSDLIVLAIAVFMHKTYRGFSFIIWPPHDFFKKEDYFSDQNAPVVIGSMLSFITVSLTFILLYTSSAIGFIIMTLFTFSVSYYCSRRKDYDDVRAAVEEYRKTH